jgi:hypothetical protein
MSFRRLATLVLLVAACGEGKLPEPGLDYGPEDAPLSVKDDSATNPASMARLRLGTPLRTTFSATSRWRAFKFAATGGEKFDIYVDGLNGLDTVAYVYNVSATTGRPYGRSIAKNDDTETEGWTANEMSSSILGFVPRYSRDYAIVVTTYRQAGRGTASVLVKRAQAVAEPFIAGGSARFVDLQGVRAEVMRVKPEVSALAGAVPGSSQGYSTFAAAYRVSPADLSAAIAADPSRPAIVGAAFADAFGASGDDEFAAYLARDSTVAAAPLQRLGETLTQMLRDHLRDGIDAAEWSIAGANYDQLGAALVAAGATRAFSVRMEESGDWSDLAVVVLDVATGDVRLVCIRREG